MLRFSFSFYLDEVFVQNKWNVYVYDENNDLESHLTSKGGVKW